jgi:transcriptional regulator with XRE-family HTH domain
MEKLPAKYRIPQRTIPERLDLIRYREGLPSDYKLALFLGIGETALANYRKGRSLPDHDAAIKIATALGEPPALLLMEIEAMRTKSIGAKVVWSTAIALLATALKYSPEPAGGGGKVDITSVTQATRPGGDPDSSTPGIRIVSTGTPAPFHAGPLQLLVAAVRSMVSYTPALSPA